MNLNQILGINHPIIMAPMFLVSNQRMMEVAMENGIAGCFPSLNFRDRGELQDVLDHLNAFKNASLRTGTYGVNLIAQRSNPLFEKHLKVCLERKVPYFITSLGNPKPVLEGSREYGAKVFCDVTNLKHAEKVAEMGCDGFIAVCSGAGGHAGPYPPQVLIPSLRKRFPSIPVIAAGGLATGQAIHAMLVLGAAGVSIGTRFIAITEAPVSDEYKQAVVTATMDDIMATSRISGTPCNVIATPYAVKLGQHQTWLERSLSNNARTKKYFKMFIQLRGMKQFEKALRPATYKTLWGAGHSVEHIHDILPARDVIERLVKELDEAKKGDQGS